MKRHAVRSACLLAISLAGSGQVSLAAQASGGASRGVAGSAPGAATGLTCVVARLADGDSFNCADGRKVRMLLMDTPELQQKPWGLMAKRQLETLARPGTVVRLELDRNPVDRYGRTLAYAWVGAVMLNEWMVANGWAVVLAYENVRYLERLQRAERAAQATKKGFWQAWAFRCRPADYRAHRCGDSPRPATRKSRRARGATGTS